MVKEKNVQKNMVFFSIIRIFLKEVQGGVSFCRQAGWFNGYPWCREHDGNIEFISPEEDALLQNL